MTTFDLQWFTAQQEIFLQLFGSDIVDADSRHAVGWCDKCREWSWVKSRAKRTTGLIDSGRCRITPRCTGTVWCLPLPPVDRARRRQGIMATNGKLDLSKLLSNGKAPRKGRTSQYSEEIAAARTAAIQKRNMRAVYIANKGLQNLYAADYQELLNQAKEMVAAESGPLPGDPGYKAEPVKVPSDVA